MTCNILDLYAKRHSFYHLNKNITLSDKELYQLIKNILEIYPSAFNSQSSRLVLLSRASHTLFWEIVQSSLLNMVPIEKHEGVKNKIASFAAGYGTILYFYDTEIISQQEKDFPLYASNFKNWAIQGSAILQFMIWTALANNNIGANLQHYNPLIDMEVKKAFAIPEKWELIAQMPFGGIIDTPAPHKAEHVEKMILIKA